MKKLWVVGIGPGNQADMTHRAYQALGEAEILCGFHTYLDLVRPLFPEKRWIATGMTRETERCRAALAAVAEGHSVAVVCSGDSGVYGMAGLLFQLAPDYPPVEIEVVAGVSAAMSGAALLGAPLGHDFAVISLSDLLTPWAVIEQRLRCAAQGDFAICLYNPASKRRRGHLRRACDILLEYQPEDTLCGWTRNIGRTGQKQGTLSLLQLRDFEADMFTTVFVGSRSTRELSGRMVTPRGYEARL